MYEPHLRRPLYFKIKEFIPSAILSLSNIFGIKLVSGDVLFVSESPESFSLGYSAPSVLSISVWVRGS